MGFGAGGGFGTRRPLCFFPFLWDFFLVGGPGLALNRDLLKLAMRPLLRREPFTIGLALG
ncbi:MAG TPA: hypothetical protein VFZ34_30015, partial [Blastocatellia bacterium]|nr:hypothetical protein [Blastocatellia bacterium]